MKAFEEKFKKTLVPEKLKPVAEGFWREALEWAKKESKDGNCGMCYTESVIEEELED